MATARPVRSMDPYAEQFWAFTHPVGGSMPRDSQKVLIVALGLVLASVVVSEANGLCVSLANFAEIYVLESFTIPSKNRCKPLGGFVSVSSVPYVLVGTGCTSADGGLFRLALTAMAPPPGTTPNTPIALNCTIPQTP